MVYRIPPPPGKQWRQTINWRQFSDLQRELAYTFSPTEEVMVAMRYLDITYTPCVIRALSSVKDNRPPELDTVDVLPGDELAHDEQHEQP